MEDFKKIGLFGWFIGNVSKLFVVSVFLVFVIGFVSSQECGDLVCEEGEEVSCLSDCTGLPEADISGNQIAPAPDYLAVEEDLVILEEESVVVSSDGLMVKIVHWLR